MSGRRGSRGREVISLSDASDRFLQKERQRLATNIAELRKRAEIHREMLESMEEQLAQEERLLREVEELSDQRPQLRLERLDRQLRGKRLQEVAVEVLRREVGIDQPIHYREWFALLRAHGFEIRGKDPLNTFLTGVGRAEGVESIGGRSGLYLLAADPA
jgi:hypothetical protein